MVEAVMQRLEFLLLWLLLLALPSSLSAHRLDENLQATLVHIETNGIQFNIQLTPGAVVAEPVLAVLDLDHDGIVSTNEAAAYAESIRRDLTARLDGQILELKLGEAESSEPAE